MGYVEVDEFGHPLKKGPKMELDEYGNPVVAKTQWQLMKEQIKGVAVTPAFQVSMGIPLVIFAITLIMWTYLWMTKPAVCVTWSVLVLIAACVLVTYHETTHAGYIIMPVCIGLFIAIFCGSFFGLYLYDTYAIFPKFYANSRSYTNVVAAESSSAVADAGKLSFNMQSYVDYKKGVGYKTETGKKYCVAPVMHKTEVKRIEFWAAGVECCEPLGDFNCDSSRDQDAHGGIPVFDNNGWFGAARYQYYEKARGKAEAQYDLQSVARPMFVRWVKSDNLNMLSNYYSLMAKLWIILLIIIFFLLFSMLAFSMWQPMKVQM